MEKRIGIVFAVFSGISNFLAIWLMLEAVQPYASPCGNELPLDWVVTIAFFVLGISWAGLSANHLWQSRRAYELVCVFFLTVTSGLVLAVGLISKLIWPITYLPICLAAMSVMLLQLRK